MGIRAFVHQSASTLRAIASIAPLLSLVTLSACAQREDQDSDEQESSPPADSKQSVQESEQEENEEESPSPQEPEEPKSSDIPDSGDCQEPARVICDDKSEDPLHALGINCPEDPVQVEAGFTGPVHARGVLQKLGKTDAFTPREGQRYLVLGTGKIEELGLETPATDIPLAPTFCSDDLEASWDRKNSFPAPLNPARVGEKDCHQAPNLVGTGDCSNSLQAQWEASKSRSNRVNDLQELRIKAKVPSWARSLSFNFAFLTTEYPSYFKHGYNDLFIAWLESKSWTGNISFDAKGNPISLNAGFLDYKDAQQGSLNDPECATGCTAPELAGSCLKGHAGTRWLSTKVGVTPGEEIELVFAIVDIGDSVMDSFVLLDNFRWSCESQKGPETDPPV